ncbi:hypothetical protein AAFF_G00002920 [Aldrovandia affinis]|uniref:Uncharacterized protein n=1 Tax=Aldrovandia affinis TaxID=143900 RepID=A0AAD7TDM2_9TELE|nr:hypothetical protein AAFF_G00002920 [Aldrovandia affinis]
MVQCARALPRPCLRAQGAGAREILSDTSWPFHSSERGKVSTEPLNEAANEHTSPCGPLSGRKSYQLQTLPSEHEERHTVQPSTDFQPPPQPLSDALASRGQTDSRLQLRLSYSLSVFRNV